MAFFYIYIMFFQPLRNLANEIIQTDINKIVNSILKNTDFNSFVLDLNRIDQLFEQGIQVDGSAVTSGVTQQNSTPGVYGKFTEELNQGRSFQYKNSTSKSKTAGDAYNFYNTGSWFESFRLVLKDDSFIITASDVHGFSMEGEYGQVLGLTEESLAEVIKALTPILRQRLINRLTR